MPRRDRILCREFFRWRGGTGVLADAVRIAGPDRLQGDQYRRLHDRPSESAMAAALGLALAGPRRYAEGLVDDPYLNAGTHKNAKPDDIGRALDLYFAACVLEGACYAALALVV